MCCELCPPSFCRPSMGFFVMCLTRGFVSGSPNKCVPMNKNYTNSGAPNQEQSQDFPLSLWSLTQKANFRSNSNLDSPCFAAYRPHPRCLALESIGVGTKGSQSPLEVPSLPELENEETHGSYPEVLTTSSLSTSQPAGQAAAEKYGF